MHLFVTLLVFGLLYQIRAQDGYNTMAGDMQIQYRRPLRPQNYGASAGGRPSWCQPVMRYCFVNPCQVSRCPAFPMAVCVNDDPCDPACTGHFYLHGDLVPDWLCREPRV
ncbi:uncharacterized protein LOC132730082 [Ruditapes philippinarum]|uniref:uncharacterized protein LOC132730082 n=1 Tax=Ruditapes philippinarum TaxID=129788 RepID=UPI00295C21F3|nr:uncharacterized protein LOC132730082 [Ruditapes philippinarum]